MSAVEALAPSRRLRSAARAELERASKRHDQLRSKASALRAELDRVDAAVAELEDQMTSLTRFAEVDGDLPAMRHDTTSTSPRIDGNGITPPCTHPSFVNPIFLHLRE